MATADSTGKAPAFQFYPSDFIEGTIDLAAEDVGVYLRLLCYQWAKGAIPGNTLAQARIAGVSSGKMRTVWSHIRRHFVSADGEQTFQNRRLERERIKQAEYRRLQSDKGKASAAKRQPSTNRGLTAVQPSHQPNRQPEGNSSVFCLQTSVKKIGGDEKVEQIASDFLEEYPSLYARVRHGARYAVSRVAMDRDLDYARDLARGWPDLARLLNMAEIFLLAEIGDKNRPGTIGQFLHYAPECDGLLRKNGR